MEIAHTTNLEAEMFTYEIRVDLADGLEVVTLEACSIREALDRASKIWSNPERVTLLGSIDREPQRVLAFL